MANINKELNDIKNAKYGRDVRGAIHDGIDKINKESEDSKQKANEAHDVMESILDESFDSSLLESNFEQKLDDKIGQLQPEWTQFKNDTEQNFNSVTSQLNDTKLLSSINNGFAEFGDVSFPNVFPKLPFNVYRDSDGVVKHDLDFDGLIDESFTAIYLSYDLTTNPNLDGLTPETPAKTLEKAIQISNNYDKAVIKIMDEVTHQEIFDTNINYNVTCDVLAIEPYNLDMVYFNKIPTTTALAADDNVWKITISVVNKILDLNRKDYRDLPTELVKVSSLSECKATPGSWYKNGNDNYIHTLDGRKPNLKKDLIVVRDFGGLNFNIGNNTLILKNLFLALYGEIGSNQKDVLRVTGTEKSKFYASNLKMMYGYLNTLATRMVGEVYLFDCTAAKSGYDGFNYHGNGGENPYEFVFEYNCHAYDCGQVINGTANATTAHEGLSIIRVNGVGFDCKGPVMADVEGCKSYLIDCNYRNSLRVAGNPKSAFWFDGSGDSGRQGEAWLMNCGGGGKDTFSINSDGLVDIYINNFKGVDIPKITLDKIQVTS